jgi:NO-binding membrane sensor protein with MHYT domain
VCLTTLSLEPGSGLCADVVVAVVASELALGSFFLLDFARSRRFRTREVIIAAAAAVAIVTLLAFWVAYRLAHPAWEGLLEIE